MRKTEKKYHILGHITPILAQVWNCVKWYYDENRIIPIEAILKRKQVDFMRNKMLFTVLKYLFLFPRYSSFMQISQVMTSYTQPNLIKYDQKRYPCQFLSEMFDSYSKILTKCAPQYELNSFLPWQHTGFQTDPIFKAFLTPLAFHFHVWKWFLICIIQQANKYVVLGLWPRLTFFELKNTNILEEGVRVCGDAVLCYFWCGFAVIFILTCFIVVSKH